ncbi:hypothetical protein [Saccharothrix deserti]|uniref:hypothetical protein n=1 Tax=Saccharothrix deserti TaxID=2593674 RepID=UPI00131B2360|nr:hypothetical protein [Saccharothrix deserti]
MSTTTETEYLGEDVPKDAPTDATTTPVVPEPEQDDQHEHVHTHDDGHVHTYVDGELSPMCIGGGCITKLPTA